MGNGQSVEFVVKIAYLMSTNPDSLDEFQKDLLMTYSHTHTRTHACIHTFTHISQM